MQLLRCSRKYAASLKPVWPMLVVYYANEKSVWNQKRQEESGGKRLKSVSNLGK